MVNSLVSCKRRAIISKSAGYGMLTVRPVVFPRGELCRHPTMKPEEKPAITPDWYEQAFDALYPIVYARRSIEAAKAEAEFAAEQVGVTRQDDLLDLCCGSGRHLVHFLDWARSVEQLESIFQRKTVKKHLSGIAKK